MSGWQVDAVACGPEAAARFATLDAVFALSGEWVASDPQSQVLRVSIAGRRYYVKQYFIGRRSLLRRWFGLRDLLGTQRVEKKWTHLQAFHGWGIPTARLVAWGLERRFGAFVRGALITEEIPQTTDLASLALAHDPRLRDRAWVAGLSHQLARHTRAMHAAGFAHNDLKWRNLLVDDRTPPLLYLIDCPSGAYWWQPFLDYRIVKDLACLDKVAKYHLSRTQRLRFYLDYAERRRLTDADKRRVRRILAFFAGRE